MRKSCYLYFDSNELEKIREEAITRALWRHNIHVNEDRENDDYEYDSRWLSNCEKWKKATYHQIALAYICFYHLEYYPINENDSLDIVVNNDIRCLDEIEAIDLYGG